MISVELQKVELYVLIGAFLFVFKLVFSEDFRDESRVKVLRGPRS